MKTAAPTLFSTKVSLVSKLAAPPSMIISTRRATSVEERGAWPPPGARLGGRDASLETTDQTGSGMDDLLVYQYFIQGFI